MASAVVGPGLTLLRSTLMLLARLAARLPAWRLTAALTLRSGLPGLGAALSPDAAFPALAAALLLPPFSWLALLAPLPLLAGLPRLPAATLATWRTRPTIRAANLLLPRRSRWAGVGI